MNIDRLIDRIEKALREEGTTDPVFHALAKEYARFRTQIDERLEHCVTLIRSGKDFAARELAEQPPEYKHEYAEMADNVYGKEPSIPKLNQEQIDSLEDMKRNCRPCFYRTGVPIYR